VAKVTFCLAHQAGQEFFIPKSFVGMTATSCAGSRAANGVGCALERERGLEKKRLACGNEMAFRGSVQHLQLIFSGGRQEMPGFGGKSGYLGSMEPKAVL
jgi:hypothetical protein